MIIFGLGNPGSHYKLTRHNAGYLFVEALARKQNKRFRTYRGYKKATVIIDRATIWLIKPLCFMNRSGHVVQAIISCHSDTFLVIIDDINLPLGRIRLRKKGGDGGHLGLRSIVDEIGHSDFPRLRIGVGRSDEDPVNHVLGRFNRSERVVLNTIINRGIHGLNLMIKKGIVDAQNYTNSINLIKNE